MKKILERFSLAGKNALVTGAGQGLGKAFAMGLAEAGANVATADIRAESAARTADEIKALGRQSLAIAADISLEEDVLGMIRHCTEHFGKLDIAVNNAGFAIPIAPVSEVSFAAWQRQMAVNLNGTFLCTKYAAESMKPHGYGKIINIASMCGHIVWPEPQAAYSVSKAGVIHLTKCLAAEYIKFGIRINCISPGVTQVEGLFSEVIDVFLKKAPLGRVGSPADHQGAVLFLASEVSDFMVGQELIIDGGYTLI
ncbi:MAG TPA: SDR family oxidoreductase [Lentisphaeria bacterium]|nr:SDR family oxidoreductase [Lentisphaeria bacterium]